MCTVPGRLDEEPRSLGYYQEAHRVWPVNLDVISWLGAFHVRNEVRVYECVVCVGAVRELKQPVC